MTLSPLSRASAALLLLFAVGCEVQPLTAAGSGGTTSGNDVTGFCNDACAAQAKCDSTVQVSACASNCVSTLGPRLRHLRSDWVASVSSCLGGADCSTWTSGTALSTCESGASAAITPSATAQSYCAQAVAKDASCGAAGGETQASCEDVVKSFDDATLTSAAQCLSLDCTQYQACGRSATGG